MLALACMYERTCLAASVSLSLQLTRCLSMLQTGRRKPRAVS